MEKSQPSVAAKAEQSCDLTVHLDVLQSLCLGLKPVNPAHFSLQFQREPYCISQDVTDTAAPGTYISLITLLGNDTPVSQL